MNGFMVDQPSQKLLKNGFQEELIRYFKDMYFSLKVPLIYLSKVRDKVFLNFYSIYLIIFTLKIY